MLIPRRISRSRIWRDFLQSMAAFLGLSALIFFSGSVFRVTTHPTGYSDPENVDSSLGQGNLGHRMLQYKESVATSIGVQQRHNRALQFMDSKKFGKDSLDSNEVINTNDFQDDIVDKSKSTSLKFDTEQRTKDTDSDIRPASPNRVDGALYLDEDRNIAVSKSITDKNKRKPSTEAEQQAASPNVEMQLSENREDQLKIKPSLSSGQLTSLSLEKNLTLAREQTKKLPKAIIIGAKKAGTRALLEFLRTHPYIEGTGPEPHFFDRNYDKGLQWYRELMPKTTKLQITIEKTPGYFVTKDAPRRIFEMDPEIKLILVVRDPVTRAISDYCQAATKHPMRPFEEMALLDERLGLVNTSWGAIKIGVYAKHMEHWLQVFSLDQIHLVDGQKLIEEPARELAKVETFLGIPKFIKDSHFYLRGFKGTFPCLIRDGKPHCLDEKTKGRDHPVVKENVLKRLRDFYRPFNAKFFQMVGRNFEWS